MVETEARELRAVNRLAPADWTPEPPLLGKLVYVVDDDPAVANLVYYNLVSCGYQVQTFNSGMAMLDSLETEAPDLIVLDIMMPGTNGLEVARRVRQTSEVPILMLSIRDEVPTKLAALDLGADDYLTKPFEVEELLARVRAILRRTTSAEERATRTTFQSGPLSVDLGTTRVTFEHKPVKLTPQEWAVLHVMVKHDGQVVGSRQLLQEAWGPDYGDEGDYVRAYINRLRRKLEPDPQHPVFILLERGMGYRLAEPE